MATTENLNIPNVSVTQMITLLCDLYSPCFTEGVKPTQIPAVMLWGAPGVGKSQGVKEVAETLGAKFGKKTIVTDVRLLLFNPIDLRGIPVANEDKTLARWLKPEIFQMDPSPEVTNILFLDEITSAPQSVQAAAYQITLDRKVGEHKLPDNCLVICAGNRTTDQSVAFHMPRALANRLLHLNIEVDFSSWKKWALQSSIDPRVIAFLENDHDFLNQNDPSKGDTAFPTPRSWEMVSNIIKGKNDLTTSSFPLLAGLVGMGVAVNFRAYSTLFNKLPKMSDIFEGKRPPLPRSADVMFALVSSMTSYAKGVSTDLIKLGNSIAYAKRFPHDFRALLLDNYLSLDELMPERLKRIPEYIEYTMEEASKKNGY
jgi:hypothetical protein